jgi:adenylate cyclase
LEGNEKNKSTIIKQTRNLKRGFKQLSDQFSTNPTLRNMLASKGLNISDSLRGFEAWVNSIEENVDKLFKSSGGDWDKFNLLIHMGQEVNSSIDLERVMQMTLEKSLSLTEAERGFILLIDADKKEIQQAATSGVDLEDSSDAQQQISRTIALNAFEEGEPVLTTNAAGDERFLGAQSVQSLALRTVICVPIRIADEKIGVVYLDSRVEGKLLSRFELDLIKAFSNLAAIAISNARLFRRLEETYQQLNRRERLVRFISPAVVDRLMQDNVDLELGGEIANITVMFSDIRGFTTFSEHLSPDEVLSSLNEIYQELTQVIFDHEGTIDKFLGDGVMALFGAPIYRDDHAISAVSAALVMQEKISELSAKFEARGRSPIRIGIGVNTGSTIVGHMGSRERMDYTAIGDAVNVSSRLCDVAQGGEVLVTDSTLEKVRNKVEYVELEPREVKGRSALVNSFRVLRMK